MSLMIHLEYPRSDSFLFWDELECLTRALGFPPDHLIQEIPKEYCQENGISIENFNYLIDKHHCFDRAVDQTFNIHSPQWNLKVIKKAVYFLSHKAITFKQLFEIRIAYQVYETLDTRGLSTEGDNLRKALKMCNFDISPMKQAQRLKHMQVAFSESNRMQLDEFLQLILWCKQYEKYENRNIRLNLKKNSDTNLFQLEDFKEILNHHDVKIGWKLDEEYLREERAFSQERHGSKKVPKESTIDPEVRRRMVAEHMKKYMPLKTEMSNSQLRVQSAQAGYVRNRPIRTPSIINQFNFEKNWKSLQNSRPSTTQERLRMFFKRSHTSSESCRENSYYKPSVKNNSKLFMEKRPNTCPAIICQEDIDGLERNVSEVLFNELTLENDYKDRLMDDLEYLFPGYSKRMDEKLKNMQKPTISLKNQNTGKHHKNKLINKKLSANDLKKSFSSQKSLDYQEEDSNKETIEDIVATKEWKRVVKYLDGIPLYQKQLDCNKKLNSFKNTRDEKTKLNSLVNLVGDSSPYMAKELFIAASSSH